MFHDASHAERDQLDGIRLPSVAMDNRCIMLVDDWNYDLVRRGTFAGLDAAGCRIHYALEVRTNTKSALPTVFGPKRDWYRGMFGAATSRNSPAG